MGRVEDSSRACGLPAPREGERSEGVSKLHSVFIAEEVMAAVRHDLLNTLTGLTHASAHLRRYLEANADMTHADTTSAASKIDDCLRTIRRGIADATQIVGRRFVPLAGSAPEGPGLFDVGSVVASVCASMEQAERLDAVVPKDVPLLVDADAREIDVALCCLLENAFDAIRGRGAAVVRVRCRSRDEAAVIEITDDGPGFGPGILERAFEPFFTTQSGRLGLGLNIAKRIALRSGGRIEIGAGAGGGGRQALVLPLAGGGGGGSGPVITMVPATES